MDMLTDLSLYPINALAFADQTRKKPKSASKTMEEEDQDLLVFKNQPLQSAEKKMAHQPNTYRPPKRGLVTQRKRVTGVSAPDGISSQYPLSYANVLSHFTR